VSRSAADRLRDILAASDAIALHLASGPTDNPFGDGLVFDAVRVRLIEIGEAVKDLPENVTATEPEMPWQEIAGMRDRLAHRYFDTSHAILSATVRNDLTELRTTVERLLERFSDD